MTTLRVLTGGANPSGRPKKHSYTCPCQDCLIERATRAEAVCRCERPTLYVDDQDDLRCTCGRAARRQHADAA